VEGEGEDASAVLFFIAKNTLFLAAELRRVKYTLG